MDAGEKRIQTFVRVKPTADFAQDVIKLGGDNKSIDINIKKDAKSGIVNNRRTDWSFRLDGVLHDVSQDVVYETVARKLVSEALMGYNGTIMCYGQTGAGKTYTMTGDTAQFRHRGIVPRAIQQVFKAVADSTNPVINVKVSYLEIYNETLCDLLSTGRSSGSGEVPMAVVDSPQGVYVKGLSLHPVRHEEDALCLLFEGETNRAIAEHTLNKNSSRSHRIFTVYIESCFRAFSDTKYVRSKINLIDLAGSERLSKTGSEGQVLKEAAYINKSLSFLEQLIIALADPKREHVPFRQSKLTHVLRDSLGGNCNTVLVANIRGEAVHLQESLSSLRFAARMKCIATEAVVHESYEREWSMKALEKENILLREELAMRDVLVNRPMDYGPLTDDQVAEIKSQVVQFLKGTIDEIDILSVRQVQEVFKQFKVILSQQERMVEDKFRSKYILIDKRDFAAVAAVQKAGVADVDGRFVWEEEGRDLGTRTAPVLSRRGGKKTTRRSKEQEPGKEEVESSPSVTPLDSFSPSKVRVIPSTRDLGVKDVASDQDAATGDGDVSKPAPGDDSHHPRSSPSKPAAFEQFKKELGSEINRIFEENKSILLDRSTRRRAVAQKINSIKREMDDIKKALEGQKQERQQQGEFVDDKGRLIIDEEEFQLIVKLKDLKEEYRAGYAELQDLKAEVLYCQSLVDQCRKRLLSEFETWYNESFLIPREVLEALKPGGNIRPGMVPINRVTCLERDDQERFRQMQEKTLPGGPASLSFYNARMKTDLKEASARTLSSLKQMQKKPGLLKAAGKNKPISFLQVT